MHHRILLFLLIGLLLAAGCQKTAESTTTPTSANDKRQFVLVQVHDPQTDAVKVYPEVAVEGKAKVRDILLATAKAYPEFSFTDTAYIGMGHLLTGINGVRNAKGAGAYWQFCIDNVASDRGMDEKEVAPGQTLDWHYAEYGKLPCKKIGE